MTFCETQTLVKEEPRTRSLYPLACKRWTCPECAPKRKRALKADARAGHPNSFLTLTVNPAYFVSPAHRAQELVAAWRKLRRRIIAKHKLKKLPFLCVVERTAKGEPHLHVLLRAPFIPQAWISAQMQELMGAPIVDIRRVDNEGRAAAYISKYLAKDPTKFPGLKRYWRSQDWLPRFDDQDAEPPNPDIAYHLLRMDLAEAAEYYYSLGYRFTSIDPGCWTMAKPP